MATEPKPYFMNRPEDIKRWFQEMHGYLKNCDPHFLKQGTDLEGRQYAWDGFFELKRILTEHPEDIQIKCPGCNGMTKLSHMKYVEPNVILCPMCYDKINENM